MIVEDGVAEIIWDDLTDLLYGDSDFDRQSNQHVGGQGGYIYEYSSYDPVADEFTDVLDGDTYVDNFTWTIA